MFTDAQAYELAYYTQYPDEDLAYAAKEAGVVIMGSGEGSPFSPSQVLFSYDIQKLLHSLHGGNAAEVKRRRDCLESMVRNYSNLAAWERGLLIHALGDAYAHTRGSRGAGTAFEPPLGHSFAPLTDIPSARPELFSDYIAALNRALGGRMSADQNNSVAGVLSRKGSNRDEEFLAARRLAVRLGFDSSYRPESGERLDLSLPTLSQSQVQSLMDKINSSCLCPKK